MKKKISIKELTEQYNILCNIWVEKFCLKQDIEFDYWITDQVGGLASFSGQYFFNMEDIIMDLQTNQPKRLILNWQDNHTDFNSFNDNPQFINYKSFTMGLRLKDLKKIN